MDTKSCIHPILSRDKNKEPIILTDILTYINLLKKKETKRRRGVVVWQFPHYAQNSAFLFHF